MIFLENLDNLPQILIGLTMALLTVLVPLAVAIVMDIYQRRRETEEDYSKLDLHVVLEDIFQIRLLVLWVILIFVSLFAWEVFLCDIPRLILMFSSVIGIGGIGYIIIFKIYLWIKGNNVFEFRFKHLKNLKDKKKYDDLIIAWHSVWETKNIPPKKEEFFFEIFKDTIEGLLNDEKPLLINVAGKIKPKNKNYDTTLELLNSFKSRIDARLTCPYLLITNIFPKIFEWHLEIWGKIEEEKQKDINEHSRIYDDYGRILEILNQMIETIEEGMLKGPILSYYHFILCSVDRRIRAYSKYIFDIRNKKWGEKYVTNFFPIFEDFFNNIKKEDAKTKILDKEVEKIIKQISDKKLQRVFQPKKE